MDSTIHLKTTDSTNDYLAKLMTEEQVPEGTVVVADFQTAGRGQIGNTWESAKGENLTFSMALYPDIPVASSFLLSQAVYLALIDTLYHFSIPESQIKWPNDIYVGDNKMAGFIIDQTVVGDKVTSAVVGIGLNVNQKDFSKALPNATSMAAVTGETYRLKDVLKVFRTKFTVRYNELLNEEAEDIRREYMARLFRFGSMYPYMAISDGAIFNAIITGVTPKGCLQLRLTDGTERTFAFKELRFVYYSTGLSLE
ncbi:MAG: biotin--[Paludibacteraceae bacterium]|nr:biotin--[acetyl-CoA-carboxylase] ligase [Paludibacteraceae bacterium]